jgi:large-conductance mechanosensitive channel
MIGVLISQVVIATVVSLLWVRAIDKQIEHSNKHLEEKPKDHVDTDNN